MIGRRAMIFSVGALAAGAGSSLAQTGTSTGTGRITPEDILRALENARRSPGQTGGAGLTAAQADAGLRQALELGVTAAAGRLGRVDGFFADPQVKIPLPGVLGTVQRNLSPLGLAGPFDDLQLRLNRAAEAAMPEARRLFLDAVRGITFQDAIGIVRGGETAGTQFLRGRTEARLTTLVRPLMSRALTTSGAYGALDRAARRNGLASQVPRLREDITAFGTQKALDGAFFYLAAEERAIRQDPARRTTDLLRRVFG